MAQYIGKYEIDTLEELENNRFNVSFKSVKNAEGGEYTPPTELYTKDMFDAVVTDEESDAQTLQDARVNKITEEVMKVLFNYNVYIGKEPGVRNEFELIFGNILDRLKDAEGTIKQNLYGVPESHLSILNVFDTLLEQQSNNN